MTAQWSGNESEEDTLTIMVATDNHLGYIEKDPVRGDDSFAAFEEILSLAAESEVVTKKAETMERIRHGD